MDRGLVVWTNAVIQRISALPEPKTFAAAASVVVDLRRITKDEKPAWQKTKDELFTSDLTPALKTEISQLWRKLEDLEREKEESLEDDYERLRAVNTQVERVVEKAKLRQDWLHKIEKTLKEVKIGTSAASVATSRTKYESLQKEIVAHADWVQSVLAEADDIIDEHGDYYPELTGLTEKIDSDWANQLLQLEAFRERIENSSNLQSFYRDCENIENLLRSYSARIEREQLEGSDFQEALDISSTEQPKWIDQRGRIQSINARIGDVASRLQGDVARNLSLLTERADIIKDLEVVDAVVVDNRIAAVQKAFSQTDKHCTDKQMLASLALKFVEFTERCFEVEQWVAARHFVVTSNNPTLISETLKEVHTKAESFRLFRNDWSRNFLQSSFEEISHRFGNSAQAVYETFETRLAQLVKRPADDHTVSVPEVVSIVSSLREKEAILCAPTGVGSCKEECSMLLSRVHTIITELQTFAPRIALLPKGAECVEVEEMYATILDACDDRLAVLQHALEEHSFIEELMDLKVSLSEQHSIAILFAAREREGAVPSAVASARLTHMRLVLTSKKPRVQQYLSSTSLTDNARAVEVCSQIRDIWRQLRKLLNERAADDGDSITLDELEGLNSDESLREFESEIALLSSQLQDECSHYSMPFAGVDEADLTQLNEAHKEKLGGIHIFEERLKDLEAKVESLSQSFPQKAPLVRALCAETRQHFYDMKQMAESREQQLQASFDAITFYRDLHDIRSLLHRLDQEAVYTVASSKDLTDIEWRMENHKSIRAVLEQQRSRNESLKRLHNHMLATDNLVSDDAGIALETLLAEFDRFEADWERQSVALQQSYQVLLFERSAQSCLQEIVWMLRGLQPFEDLSSPSQCDAHLRHLNHIKTRSLTEKQALLKKLVQTVEELSASGYSQSEVLKTKCDAIRSSLDEMEARLAAARKQALDRRAVLIFHELCAAADMWVGEMSRLIDIETMNKASILDKSNSNRRTRSSRVTLLQTRQRSLCNRLESGGLVKAAQAHARKLIASGVDVDGQIRERAEAFTVVLQNLTKEVESLSIDSVVADVGPLALQSAVDRLIKLTPSRGAVSEQTPVNVEIWLLESRELFDQSQDDWTVSCLEAALHSFEQLFECIRAQDPVVSKIAASPSGALLQSLWKDVIVSGERGVGLVGLNLRLHTLSQDIAREQTYTSEMMALANSQNDANSTIETLQVFLDELAQVSPKVKARSSVLKDLETRVAQLPSKSEKIDQAWSRLRKDAETLNHRIATKQSELGERIEFLVWKKKLESELVWLDSAIARGQSEDTGANASATRQLVAGHQLLLSELKTHAILINSMLSSGKTLAAKNNTCRSAYQDQITQVEKSLQALTATVQRRKLLLDHALIIHTFNKEADSLERWIAPLLRSTAGALGSTVEETQALIDSHNEIESSIKQRQTAVDSLSSILAAARKLVPQDSKDTHARYQTSIARYTALLKAFADRTQSLNDRLQSYQSLQVKRTQFANNAKAMIARIEEIEELTAEAVAYEDASDRDHLGTLISGYCTEVSELQAKFEANQDWKAAGEDNALSLLSWNDLRERLEETFALLRYRCELIEEDRTRRQREAEVVALYKERLAEFSTFLTQAETLLPSEADLREQAAALNKIASLGAKLLQALVFVDGCSPAALVEVETRFQALLAKANLANANLRALSSSGKDVDSFSLAEVTLSELYPALFANFAQEQSLNQSIQLESVATAPAPQSTVAASTPPTVATTLTIDVGDADDDDASVSSSDTDSSATLEDDSDLDSTDSETEANADVSTKTSTAPVPTIPIAPPPLSAPVPPPPMSVAPVPTVTTESPMASPSKAVLQASSSSAVNDDQPPPLPEKKRRNSGILTLPPTMPVLPPPPPPSLPSLPPPTPPLNRVPPPPISIPPPPPTSPPFAAHVALLRNAGLSPGSNQSELPPALSPFVTDTPNRTLSVDAQDELIQSPNENYLPSFSDSSEDEEDADGGDDDDEDDDDDDHEAQSRKRSTKLAKDQKDRAVSRSTQEIVEEPLVEIDEDAFNMLEELDDLTAMIDTQLEEVVAESERQEERRIAVAEQDSKWKSFFDPSAEPPSLLDRATPKRRSSFLKKESMSDMKKESMSDLEEGHAPRKSRPSQ